MNVTARGIKKQLSTWQAVGKDAGATREVKEGLGLSGDATALHFRVLELLSIYKQRFLAGPVIS